MRYLLIAAVIAATVAVQTVSAAGSGLQQHAMPGAAPAPPVHQVPAHPTTAPPPPPAPPPQPVGPPIVFPFPPLMTPPAGGLTPPAGGLAPEFVAPPPGRMHSPRFGRFGSPFFAPFVAGYSAVADSVGVATPSAPVAAATGLLRLSVTPSSAQVFIDSYYVGTVADIEAQRVLTLEAGPHRIEFRAPQYETLTVDVRIMPHELVTYRGALEPARPAVPAASALTASPSPMYLIPNCYLGNVPPRPSRLPAGCDINKVQVLGSK
jgi:hypothetical protein